MLSYIISRTVDVASACYAILFGTVALEPVFDDDVIDLKNVKMTVDCNNPNGYSSSVDAQLRGKSTFWFNSTTSQRKKSIIVKY
jgi:hypothetical protein